MSSTAAEMVISDRIAGNLKRVHEEMARACDRVGRAHNEVELVAVTKTHEAETIAVAFDQGQRLFGESRVQEARAKIPLLPAPARWHFIGHLQKNKIRHALPLFEMIHSVDSVELAQQIDRIAAEEGLHPRVLVEINVAGEASKHGVPVGNAEAALEKILALPRLSLEGLMTIPPLARDPENSRPFFRKLRQLREEVEVSLGMKLAHLSMGMSDDFTVAIEEGATLVRVGTRIFGAR